MNHIEEKFKGRGHQSKGGELYLTLADAREFVAALREAGYAILGLEAVHREAGKIFPLLDQIADFSAPRTEDWHSRVEASSRAAAGFLDQLPNDPRLMVTVVAIPRPEDRA